MDATRVKWIRFEMKDFNESLEEFPIIEVKEGDCVLNQGERTDSLYVLHSGKVTVIKDGYDVAITSEKGTVFGEMSIFLDKEHSASVQCMTDSTFYHIDKPQEYLESNPAFIWHIATLLSSRLYNLNQYLVDIKSQNTLFNNKSDDREKMANDVLKILQGN